MAGYLVTGGGGFLGAEIVAALAGRGNRVVAFDLRSSARLDALVEAHSQVSFVEGEIVEWPALAAVVQELRPEGIVHCAAVVGVPASLLAPLQTMRVNVEGAMNVMEAMRLFGTRRMVHISSEETYGHFESETITEEHPQRPLMAYGISKLAVEHLGRSYAERYGLECLNVRTCWVYGPGLPRPRVPKTLIDAAAEGRPLHLETGADFAVDHTYVDDLVDGILLVLDHGEHPYDAYHIASGEAPTLAEIVAIIKALVPGAELSVGPGGIEFVPGMAAWRKGALDVSRAAEVLGYRPRYDIRAGIAASLAAARSKEEAP